jgi:hypothetical protein
LIKLSIICKRNKTKSNTDKKKKKGKETEVVDGPAEIYLKPR